MICGIIHVVLQSTVVAILIRTIIFSYGIFYHKTLAVIFFNFAVLKIYVATKKFGATKATHKNEKIKNSTIVWV